MLSLLILGLCEKNGLRSEKRASLNAEEWKRSEDVRWRAKNTRARKENEVGVLKRHKSRECGNLTYALDGMPGMDGTRGTNHPLGGALISNYLIKIRLRRGASYAHTQEWAARCVLLCFVFFFLFVNAPRSRSKRCPGGERTERAKEALKGRRSICRGRGRGASAYIVYPWTKEGKGNR